MNLLLNFIANATFTRHMCYLEIDKRLWQQIDNKRNISTATAANLAVLLNKARKISKSIYEKTLNQLIAISDKIKMVLLLVIFRNYILDYQQKTLLKLKKYITIYGELLKW